jgi:hypothetical protein
MLEKTEGSIKNGQSGGTVNNGHTRHRTKKNNLNITGKMKKMSNDDPHEIRGNPRCSRSASISCFLSDTCHVTHIVKFCISVAGDRGKVKLRKEGKTSKLQMIWICTFRRDDFLSFSKSESRISYDSHIFVGTRQNDSL